MAQTTQIYYLKVGQPLLCRLAALKQLRKFNPTVCNFTKNICFAVNSSLTFGKSYKKLLAKVLNQNCSGQL